MNEMPRYNKHNALNRSTAIPFLHSTGREDCKS